MTDQMHESERGAAVGVDRSRPWWQKKRWWALYFAVLYVTSLGFFGFVAGLGWLSREAEAILDAVYAPILALDGTTTGRPFDGYYRWAERRGRRFRPPELLRNSTTQFGRTVNSISDRRVVAYRFSNQGGREDIMVEFQGARTDIGADDFKGWPIVTVGRDNISINGRVEFQRSQPESTVTIEYVNGVITLRDEGRSVRVRPQPE
jgi:hypothetical protein